MKKKNLPDTEKRLIAEETWQQHMTDLQDQTHTIYEQASEIFNLKYIARIAGSNAALDELMGVLKHIGEATQDAKHSVAVKASSAGYNDTHIAARLGLHRHTVRRWREAYEQYERDNTMSTEEVDELTQGDPQ